MKIFDGIRRVIVFTLGVIIILDELRMDEASIPALVVGMVMVGILPISDLPFLHHQDRNNGSQGESSSRTRDFGRTNISSEKDVDSA